VPQGFHRQDACATRISQARCLCHKDSCGVGILPAQTLCTGKMPVPQGFHRQDACATNILVGWASCPPKLFAQARCLCHKYSCGVGILPAPNYLKFS
ncbi:hypothetical protein QT990_08355, partial [Microcoleus sp. T3_B1]|uniref:hypothetical protein n=1 Tax=Microcoleus sp. T3_B1 TaxID=3055425 RepID=UPI002FD2C073